MHTISVMRVTPKLIRRWLDLIDWSGHVELPTNDMDWLAEMIAARLTNPNQRICENCDTPREIVIPTALGNICEECLEELSEQAEAIRGDLEDA